MKKKKYNNQDELMEDVTELKIGEFVREYVRLVLEEHGEDEELERYIRAKAGEIWGACNGSGGCVEEIRD